MKREGRQHGMVRTNKILPQPWNPRPNTRFINRLDSPPSHGLFTKVQPKPTNHSKFTGKCSKPRCHECHVQPCSKSKDKTKGTHKLKPCDLMSHYRLISWRVVNGRPGLNFTGFSASGMLDRLDRDHLDDAYDDEENQVVDDDDNFDSSGAMIQEIMEDDDHHYNSDDKVKEKDNDEDDFMNFYDVGFLMDQVEEDEGWCLVDEM